MYARLTLRALDDDNGALRAHRLPSIQREYPIAGIGSAGEYQRLVLRLRQ